MDSKTNIANSDHTREVNANTALYDIPAEHLGSTAVNSAAESEKGPEEAQTKAEIFYQSPKLLEPEAAEPVRIPAPSEQTQVHEIPKEI